MSDSDRFLRAISELEEIADSISVDEAQKALDSATLQVFWRTWPHVSGWAGGLWRRLNDEVAQPATPVRDPDLDEVGEGGGG